MCRIERLAEIAHRAAIQDTDEGCSFLLGAVVAKGSRILATGACSTKTDPKNPKLQAKTERWQICAEVRACLNALRGTASLKGCTVYVVRVTKTGSQYMMARPCEHCQRFLKERRVKRVYYSNQHGEIIKMDLFLDP